MWNDIKETMPNEGVEVLVYPYPSPQDKSQSVHAYTAWFEVFEGDVQWWYWTEFGELPCHPTHWMPVPDEPVNL